MNTCLKSNIADLISKAEESYIQGKYNKSADIYQALCEKVESTKSVSEVNGFDKCAFTCALRNNILVLNGLEFNWNTLNAYEKWNQLMESFMLLNQEMEILYTADKIVLKSYLNVVYNSLWWGWWSPLNLQNDRSHVGTCLEISIGCFKKVLEKYHVVCPSSSHIDTEAEVLHIMKELLNNFLILNGEECLQLLEIYVIIIYTIIELKPKGETISECIEILTSILDSKSVFLRSLDLSKKQKRNDEVKFPTNLKFGFHEMNNRLEKSGMGTVLEILQVAQMLCYFQVEHFKRCVAYMNSFEITEGRLHSLWIYLKAYGCYQNNELELCLYSLFELEKVPVDKHLKIRYHLLYGSLLSRRERHFEALKEFFKPLSIALEDKQEGSNFYAVALYLIAEEYEKLFNKAHAIQKENVQHNERYKKIISEAPGKLYVLLRADHLETLQKLVTVLKEGDDCITNISITGRILNMLHPQPEVNLPIAIYKLASRLAMDESYSNAAELFVELLAQTDLQPVPSLIMQLPSLSVIYHSAATMLLKSNDLQQAEQLCNRVISFHSSKSARPVDMEHSLLCLQEDLVALMLLARIHRLRAEVILESEILDKCVRVIYHYTNQNNSSNEDMKNVNTSEPNIMQLLNILASKLHLQKAQNYLLRGSDFDNDAFFQFKQAIFHNPRDRDVVSAYISFLKDNHLDEPNVLRTLDNCSHFHGEETNSSALKYLMQPEDKDDSDMDMFAE